MEIPSSLPFNRNPKFRYTLASNFVQDRDYLAMRNIFISANDQMEIRFFLKHFFYPGAYGCLIHL